MSGKPSRVIVYNPHTTITTGVTLPCHNTCIYCGAPIPPCQPHAIVTRHVSMHLLINHTCNQGHGEKFAAIAPYLLIYTREIALQPPDGVLT